MKVFINVPCKSLLLVFSSITLFISGCMIGPDYEAPELNTPSAYHNAASNQASSLMGGWRQLFQSPELIALIEKAERNNHTLIAAWQSVVASRAITRRFKAEGLPQVDTGLSVNYFNNSDAVAQDGSGDSGERYDADVLARWELDLFGKIRRSVQAAEANADAQEALYQDFLFTLQADVASLYFQIQSFQSEIELLQRSQETRQESLDLIKQRFQAGTVSELAVAQTTSLLANAESRLYSAMRTQNSLKYALAALLGETPGTFRFIPSPLDDDPPKVPAGIPGDLLSRRPDIRAAERSLAASNEFVGVAKASFFPSITLSGTLGYASRDWNNLFNSGSSFDSLRPGVTVPLFEGGRLRANEQQALALYKKDLELYMQTVISAVTETEDMLQSIRLLDQQRIAIGKAVEASQQARRISLLQYQRGLSDFITALDAERTALDAEQQFVQVKRAQYLAAINLVRALGGAW